MKPIVIRNSIIPKLFSWFLTVRAITIWPFIFIRDEGDNKLITHEKIHIAQYNELLVIGFLALYLYDWIKGLLYYRDAQQAYYMIRFEQEAYRHQTNKSYLEKRKRFAWKRYTVNHPLQY